MATTNVLEFFLALPWWILIIRVGFSKAFGPVFHIDKKPWLWQVYAIINHKKNTLVHHVLWAQREKNTFPVYGLRLLCLQVWGLKIQTPEHLWMGWDIHLFLGMGQYGWLPSGNLIQLWKITTLTAICYHNIYICMNRQFSIAMLNYQRVTCSCDSSVATSVGRKNTEHRTFDMGWGRWSTESATLCVKHLRFRTAYPSQSGAPI